MLQVTARQSVIKLLEQAKEVRKSQSRESVLAVQRVVPEPKVNPWLQAVQTVLEVQEAQLAGQAKSHVSWAQPKNTNQCKLCQFRQW